MGIDQSEGTQQGSGHGVSGSGGARERRWHTALDVVTSAGVLILVCTTLWSRYSSTSHVPARASVPLPTHPVSINGLPLLGAPTAPVGLVVFSDFQCPYCARFDRDTMPALKARYIDTGLVRVGFRHLPLPIHARAERMAEGAECAAEQGKFWPMHDALFSRPSQFNESDLLWAATAIGLDRVKFEACMSHPPSERVKQDSDIARGMGLTATPSFVVGTIQGDGLHATSVLIGARPVNDFELALDQALRSGPGP